MSSEMGLVHRPQYHPGLFLIAVTTSIMTSQVSAVQYFLQLSRHTLSSMQAVGTFSGLTSTSSSSTILPSMIAAVAMSLCTNQGRIAAWEENTISCNRYHNTLQVEHVSATSAYKLCLSPSLCGAFFLTLEACTFYPSSWGDLSPLKQHPLAFHVSSP